MNKRKILLLTDFIMVLAAIITLVVAIITSVYGISKPVPDSVLHLTGLFLPAIILSSVFLMIYWGFRRSFMILIPILALLINYNSILGNIQFRFKKSSPDITNSSTLKIASYNIHEFISKEDLSLVSDLAEFIKSNNTDIICFQEFRTPYFLNKKELISYFDFLPFYFIKEADMEEIGMAIFSRYPIIRAQRVDFENTGNGTIWADLQINDKKVFRIVNNHLQTTNYERNRDANISGKIEFLKNNSILRAHQAEVVRKIIDTTTIPVIVCGDFNDIPNSYTFKKITGENLVDGFREGGSGLGGTYRGMGGLLRIDYILHSKEFKCVTYSSPNLDFSDHRPVISELVFRN